MTPIKITLGDRKSQINVIGGRGHDTDPPTRNMPSATRKPIFRYETMPSATRKPIFRTENMPSTLRKPIFRTETMPSAMWKPIFRTGNAPSAKRIPPRLRAGGFPRLLMPCRSCVCGFRDTNLGRNAPRTRSLCRSSARTRSRSRSACPGSRRSRYRTPWPSTNRCGSRHCRNCHRCSNGSR